MTLLAYVEQLTGGATGLTEAQTKAADVDSDNEITVSDAQFILIYYVRNSVAGENVPWREILAG